VLYPISPISSQCADKSSRGSKALGILYDSSNRCCFSVRIEQSYTQCTTEYLGEAQLWSRTRCHSHYVFTAFPIEALHSLMLLTLCCSLNLMAVLLVASRVDLGAARFGGSSTSSTLQAGLFVCAGDAGLLYAILEEAAASTLQPKGYCRHPPLARGLCLRDRPAGVCERLFYGDRCEGAREARCDARGDVYGGCSR
jgi:hypothetical protein